MTKLKTRPPKLKPSEVKDIRALYATGKYPMPMLAQIYGVCTDTISHVVNRTGGYFEQKYMRGPACDLSFHVPSDPVLIRGFR